jgi:hypothetical protein
MFGNPIVIGGIRKSYNPKCRNRWGLEVNIPAVVADISASKIGTMLAAESIDYIRLNWEQGKDAQGQSRQIKDATRRRREKHKKFLTDNEAKFSSWAEAKQYLGDQKQFLTWLKRNYTKIIVATDVIDGVKTRTRSTSLYFPEPTNPAINQSGLMRDSLRGRFMMARTATINGQQVDLSQQIELRVSANRALTASRTGGLNGSTALPINRRTCPNTFQVVDNALWWKTEENLRRIPGLLWRTALILNQVAKGNFLVSLTMLLK